MQLHGRLQGVATVALAPCISKLAILGAFSGFWVSFCLFRIPPPGKTSKIFAPPPAPPPANARVEIDNKIVNIVKN